MTTTETAPGRVPDGDCDPRPAPVQAIGAAASASVSATLKALAEPLRLRMLSLLATAPTGEVCVCDLADLSDVSQPTVSHHLKVLRESGIVASQRRGTWVWYRIAPGYAPAVAALLDAFAPAVLRAPQAETTMAGLADVDGALDRVAANLAVTFSQAQPDLVRHVVRESYTGLARSAAVRAHLVPLAERFARQRLTDLTRDGRDGRPQVLFVCVANAGRSQLAAALLRHHAGDRVVVRSAGSTPAGAVHPSVRPLLEKLGVDPADAFPKPLTDDAVRAADVVVTMGCGDVCPILPGTRYEDWAIADPALASADGVAAIRDELDARVRRLLDELVPTAP
ncbi:transcriptional regulator, ArsR family [Beutenbergia cavernae DSM 12333]|uniref:Transcriptional regulator, ArsR family n=1 Tax=Beutenbergia cavernae (strain ATCC BAA-8 / DSM 12333 / CCUG 43141 / JCM 11478 / NBRC 16432 / NCIMB 13614 / HKI 0122) TaxID=471853 RepID=C5BXM4_BEUC1|nr:metalloregulator ArsR/SmtB family transcription factor [Beutenbergia cavernae]ACQ80907.1 transcriptional regulator, ArsR family [Beutenbergia cavernae DSM 12333]